MVFLHPDDHLNCVAAENSKSNFSLPHPAPDPGAAEMNERATGLSCWTVCVRLTVVPSVVVKLLVVQVDDVCTHVVQKALVVGHDEKRLLPALKVAANISKHNEASLRQTWTFERTHGWITVYEKVILVKPDDSV